MNFFQKLRDFIKHSSKVAQQPVEDGSISFSVKSNGLWKRGIEFITSPSHSRTMGILMIFVLAAVVSVTVIAGQQQQNLKQKATGTEICSDTSIQACAGDPAGNPCNTKGERCRIGQNVYECR